MTMGNSNLEFIQKQCNKSKSKQWDSKIQVVQTNRTYSLLKLKDQETGKKHGETCLIQKKEVKGERFEERIEGQGQGQGKVLFSQKKRRKIINS